MYVMAGSFCHDLWCGASMRRLPSFVPRAHQAIVLACTSIERLPLTQGVGLPPLDGSMPGAK
jgi:hypothetical protein